MIDVLLLYYKEWEQPLRAAGLNVVQCDNVEEAISIVLNSDGIKVALLDPWESLGASGYLAAILRATHEACLVGKIVPAVMLQYVDKSKPLPAMADFWLPEPVTVEEILALVARYDRGEVGPPPGWNGWFFEPGELDDSKIDFDELEWQYQATVEDMRDRLSPVNFDRWFKMIKPGMEERLRRVKTKEGLADSVRNDRKEGI